MKKLFRPSTASSARVSRNAKFVASINLEQRQILDPAQVQLGSFLGQGGFAKVYHCKLDGQAAVCKVISSEKLDDEMTYLLTNECTIWAKLGHANIASFYGMAATDNSIWLVCELLPGGSLLQHLEKKRKGKAPPPATATLLADCIQIAAGMEYLHALEPPVLHRDLKSANILLADVPVDGKVLLKIADFGLARYQANAGSKMTAETGSYRWMAPEVIRHETYNERCDVYSFAVLAWEMLTYRIPFDNMQPVEAAFAVARSAKRPEIPANCPPGIASLISTCWSQEATKRPPFGSIGGATGVREALEHELAAVDIESLSLSPDL